MIPNTWHFIHLQKPLNGKQMVPFCGMQYAALLSCAETQKPDRIVVWSDGPMDGLEWFERAVIRARDFYKVPIEARYKEFKHVHKGRRIPYPGLMTDFARFEIIYEHGGIYADIDSIFLKPIRSMPAWNDDVVMACEEIWGNGEVSLVSSVLAAPVKHIVLQALLAYDEPGDFDERNAVFTKRAFKTVADKLPGQFIGLRTEPNPVPAWTDEGKSRMFMDTSYPMDSAYIVALGLSVNWYYLQFASEIGVFEMQNSYHAAIRKYFDKPALDLTAIMPVCIDSTDRFENIMTVTTYMLERLCIPQIFIVEYDTRPRLAEFFLDKPGIRYFFVQREPGALWSRTRPVNTALQWVETEAVAIWDTDALISMGQVTGAYYAVTKAGHAAATPFNTLYHIGRKHLAAVKAGRFNFGVVNDPKEVLWKINMAVAQACVFLNTAKFKHARGMSELFWGWGAEDDELLLRYTKIYGPAIQLRAPLVHFAHTRTPSCFPDKMHGKLNEGERQRIMNWTPDEIRAYYGITADVGKYSTSNHPDPVDAALEADIQKTYKKVEAQPGVPTYRET